MHRTIGYISKRLVQVRPGEGRKVLLTFLYFFLVITAYYVIKPVSRSLVLNELGSRMVPYMDLITALAMGPIVTLFARLVDRFSKKALVTKTFIAVAAVMAVFWKLLSWPHGWVVGAFYVWVSIFSVLVVTLFWLVANDLYRPRDAKRLFGFVGSGGILGGIVGSSVAAAGAQLFGTRQLLLLSAGLLLACWLIVHRLWRYAPDSTLGPQESLAAKRHDTFLSNFKGFLDILRSSRYLRLLIAIVAFTKIVATLVYYQFNPYIEQSFATIDEKTTFTAFFLGAINVAAFVVQFFFTSLILRRLGLMVALMALPIGVLCGSSSLLVLLLTGTAGTALFAVAAGTELYERSMDYSLNNNAKEVLYLPIDRTVRYKAKPFIDMVVFRFGKGLAAVIGILLLDKMGLPPWVLGALIVPLTGAWLVVAYAARKEYTMTIRTVLKARAAARAAESHNGSEGAPPEVPLTEAVAPLITP